MPYHPMILSTDDRREGRGCLPTVLRNQMVDSQPPQAQRRSAYFVRPTPGRTRQATLSANSRGLYSEPGSIDGVLIAPAGSDLNKVTSAYAVTSIGSITGTDDVQIVPFQADIALLADGLLYHNDGVTHTQITDADAPNPAGSLASCAYRLIAVNSTYDGFDWSKAGLYNNWDSAGTAADIYLPDPIVFQIEANGTLMSFNSKSLQPWQPTGGAEAEAFATAISDALRVGLLTKKAIARGKRGSLAFINQDRRFCILDGGVQEVPNRDLETALAQLTSAEIAASLRLWSYTQESKTFIGINAGLERAWVFDQDLGFFHERARYGYGAYDIDFAATAFDGQATVVSSFTQPYLWTLDLDVYTEDSSAIERETIVHIPTPGDGSIDQIVFDMEFRDQPTTGQGSSPQMMVSISKDGGETWTDERILDLPELGNYKKRLRASRWGSGTAEKGILIKTRISDPIYCAYFGLWVNPDPNEVP